ncbi:Secreted protein [Pseudomonas sp. IT-P294]
MAVTNCVKLQCVVTYLVWLKPAGKQYRSLDGRDRKILTIGDLELESSPYWGLIHLWGVSRIPGSPEPVLFSHG